LSSEENLPRELTVPGQGRRSEVLGADGGDLPCLGIGKPELEVRVIFTPVNNARLRFAARLNPLTERLRGSRRPLPQAAAADDGEFHRREAELKGRYLSV
jgi:hypothetical protein